MSDIKVIFYVAEVNRPKIGSPGERFFDNSEVKICHN